VFGVAFKFPPSATAAAAAHHNNDHNQHEGAGTADDAVKLHGLPE